MNQKIIVRGQGRLDQYLESILPFTRSQIKNYIKQGAILVNGNQVKAGYYISGGEEIEICIAKEHPLLPEKINFPVLYEDEDIAVISKPQNLVVHPGAGNKNHTLVNGLLYRFSNLSNPIDEFRPGIVHRLDKDTSGLMVIAKSEKAYYGFVEAFKSNLIHKNYLAFVHGNLTEDGMIQAPIGRSPIDRKKMAVISTHSKEAITKYKVLEEYKNFTLLNISLITGRTHQIRVHMSYIHHPVVGDLTYGYKNQFGIQSQLLHSYELHFIHPITGKNMYFQDDYPLRFQKFQNLLISQKA